MYKPDLEIEKKEILKRYRNLLRVWSTRKDLEDKRIVRKAFNLAVDAHKDMRRKSGEPYIYHPLEVARIVAGEIGLGTTSIVCALLHDVVEDTDYSLGEIRKMFGEKVARIIDGLTKIDEIFDQNSTSLQAENFKKILLTLSDDVRVILIKLADRLHNMRTLDAMSHEKQLKIASETLYLFAPLAYRLGLYAIKSELEDLALKYTETEVYNAIKKKLHESKLERQRFINKFIYPIKKALASTGMDFKIIAREKSVHSIWEKMRQKEIPFEEVFDLFAIRVIIDVPLDKEKVECWRVYSAITDYYRPNLDRLRDWISIPKANGYEALHTTVMSSSGKWVEIQIRTTRMDEISEKGYAAHWKYKVSDDDDVDSGLDEWLSKIRELIQGEESNALDFLSDFKLNLFTDEIFVFTPKGDLKNLPSGSTVLDFAYNIHSQVGNTAIGAKVNHNLVPLNSKLKNGDQVEIITSKKQVPKEDWLDSVVTARARSRIKAALKEEKKKHFESGKILLEKFFLKVNTEFSDKNISDFRKYMHSDNLTDLHYKVSTGKIKQKDVKDFSQAHERGSWLRYISRPFGKSKTSARSTLNDTLVEQLAKKPESLILGDDIEDLRYSIAKCCNPIPGDDVIGFLAPRGSINIHRTSCPVAIQNMSRYSNRMVKTKWRNNESIGFLTGVRIKGIDKPGLVKQISEIISEKYKISMRSFHMDTSEGMTEGLIMVYVQDTRTLNQLIEHLKKIKELQVVKRIDRSEIAAV
jgi:GTP pyrophosphokinase